MRNGRYLYYKCNGGGKISGYILAVFLGVFFWIGPYVVSFVPRCMAGCMLLHMGYDLCREAVVDSFFSFDALEYFSVLLIMAVMTFGGMTAGLGVGILWAALTFTIQASRNVDPIKGYIHANCLRSSHWRAPEDSQVIIIAVVWLQVQRHFGSSCQRFWDPYLLGM